MTIGNTPGPWRSLRMTNGNWLLLGPDNKVIAEVYEGSHIESTPVPAKEAQANAALFARAWGLNEENKRLSDRVEELENRLRARVLMHNDPD
mgnify:CR=1 FL=1